MKKFDVFVIFFIFIISLSFFSINFINSKRRDNLFIEVRYKNSLLYKVKLDENTNVLLEISSLDNQLSVKENDEEILYPIDTVNKIYNVILITSRETIMLDANCEDSSYHKKNKLTTSFPLPIICLNGIIVKMSGMDNKLVIIV